MMDFDGDGDIDDADLTSFWSRATFVRGDLDANGAVDAADLATMLSAWGAQNSPADLDLDGAVAASDLATLLSAWGG
jgi:hypothetical protein